MNISKEEVAIKASTIFRNQPKKTLDRLMRASNYLEKWEKSRYVAYADMKQR